MITYALAYGIWIEPVLKLLYFAWVRERIGKSDELLDVPPQITTLGALLDHLIARGGGYAAALAERDKIRLSVNQSYVDATCRIKAGDEIGIFPPVTGG